MIVGTRLYGRTDEVEGLGYVAARFFHVNFVPLIPTGETFLVVKHSFFSERQEVVQIKNDRKPVLLGYARGAAWTAALMTSFFALLNVGYVVSTGELYLRPELPGFLAACVALVLLYAPQRLRKASPERAWELAAASGVGAIEVADLLVDPKTRPAQEASTLHETCEGLPTRLAAPILLAKALPTSTPNAVKFECPICESQSKVSVEYVGRKGPCKACGLALRVPAPVAKRAARALVEWSYLSDEACQKTSAREERVSARRPRRSEVSRSRPSEVTRSRRAEVSRSEVSRSRRAEVSRSEVSRSRRAEVSRPRPAPAVLGWASGEAPLGLVG